MFFDRIFMAPDAGVDPPISVEPVQEEEIVYVDSEDQIPKEPEEESSKIDVDEVLRKQGERQNELLANLGDRIAASGVKGPPVQQGPRETDEEFQKRYDKLAFENPLKARQEYDKRYLGPVVGKVFEQNFQLKKEMLSRDPETAELFKEYGKEIDAEISRLPAAQKMDPNSLQQVLDRVKISHIDEIVEKKVADLIAKSQAPVGEEQRTVANTTFVSGGGVRSAAMSGDSGVKKKYVVKPPPNVMRLAEKKGVDPNEFYRILKENTNG